MVFLKIRVEDCIPELVLDKMRPDIISGIGGTGKRLLFSGPVARENPGKIQEIIQKNN